MYKKHECPKAPEGHLDSLKTTYGWLDDTMIPLNGEAGGHEKNGCPYCKMPWDSPDMKPMTGAEERSLRKIQK